MSLNVHQLIFGGIWGQLKQAVNTNDVLANQTWEALAFIEIYMAVCMTNRQKVKYQLFYWLYFGLLQLLKKMSCSLIAKCWLVAGHWTTVSEYFGIFLPSAICVSLFSKYSQLTTTHPKWWDTVMNELMNVKKLIVFMVSKSVCLSYFW